MNLREICRRS